MKPEKAAWTVGTAGRGDAELEQFAGSMVVRGATIDQGAIIGATKDKRGGVGYLALFSSKVADEAVAEIQTIIQSSH
jgi:hypothetical protein